MTSERAHWDAVAGDDPATMIRHGDWEASIRSDLARLPAMKPGARLLDLGCGLGRLSVAYAERYGTRVVGVDISAAMLRRAARHPLVDYRQCDGRSVRRLAPFDGAWSMLMFQHIPAHAQRGYVRSVAQKLKPGGWFVFQTVIGTEDTFLSHQVDADAPAAWCEAAGLTVEQVTRGEPAEWLWVDARRTA